MEFKKVFSVIFFIILSGVKGLFLLESKAQDFSVGLMTEFSENKFIPSLMAEKKIRKKNFIQLSFSAGKFTDGYYPDQLWDPGKDPLFRERVWELPYSGLGPSLYPNSNKVVISGFKIQIGYLEYFPLKNKKHKLFWNLNFNFHALKDEYETVFSNATYHGDFKFIVFGTSIRFGYRFIFDDFHFTAFTGPTQYLDFYPASKNISSYPIVAPFVDLELEGGLSIGYSF